MASNEDRKKATIQSELFQQQSTFLQTDVQRVLKLTNGSVTWREVPHQISGNSIQPVCVHTIADHIMSLPGSSYKTTDIHPHLSDHHKQKRLSWSNQFWLFWNSATEFNQCQVIIVHLDEKWFFGLVVRKKNKSVPFLGVEPVSHSIHHRSHINKVVSLSSIIS
jgi:hypothetical protein